jgi:hypothetical protein
MGRNKKEEGWILSCPLSSSALISVGTGEGHRVVDKEADNKSADEDRWLVIGGECR